SPRGPSPGGHPPEGSSRGRPPTRPSRSAGIASKGVREAFLSPRMGAIGLSLGRQPQDQIGRNSLPARRPKPGPGPGFGRPARGEPGLGAGSGGGWIGGGGASSRGPGADAPG